MPLQFVLRCQLQHEWVSTVKEAFNSVNVLVEVTLHWQYQVNEARSDLYLPKTLSTHWNFPFHSFNVINNPPCIFFNSRESTPLTIITAIALLLSIHTGFRNRACQNRACMCSDNMNGSSSINVKLLLLSWLHDYIITPNHIISSQCHNVYFKYVKWCAWS